MGDGGAPTGSTPNLHSNARHRTSGCGAAGDPAVIGYNDRYLPVCGGVGLASNLAGGGLRHFEGANYGFIDGHVKWLKNRDANNSSVIYNGATLFTQSGSNPTFRLRD